MQTESLARESTSNALVSQKHREKPHYEREKSRRSLHSGGLVLIADRLGIDRGGGKVTLDDLSDLFARDFLL